MFLHRWMRRVAGFCSWLWLDRADLLRDVLSSNAKPANTWKPRPDTRLSLVTLEGREVPNDIFGPIRGSFVVGGLALLAGTERTPGDVALGGWGGMAEAAPPPWQAASSSTAQTLHEGMPRDAGSLFLGATIQPGFVAGGGSSPVASGPAGRRSGPAEGMFDEDFLTGVGAFLGQARHGQGAMGSSLDDASGGHNGGGGNGPVAPGSVSFDQAGVPSGGGVQAGASTAAAGVGGMAAAGVPAPSRAGTTQGASSGTSGSGPGAALPASKPALDSLFGQTPLAFEVNQGQAGNSSVLALSHGPGFGFWLTQQGMVFALPHHDASGALAGRDVFTLQLAGASACAKLVPGDPLPGQSSYFVGADSSQWQTDVAQYGSLTLQGVYPGIDLVLHSHSASDRSFEYDFLVHPGANPASIRMNAQGLDHVRGDARGRLLLGTSGGDVVMASPQLYQSVDGHKQSVAGRYVLGRDGHIGFQVSGRYDAREGLLLDPELQLSSYLGGSGDDTAYGVATDSAGNSYVTGATSSTDFPSQNGYQSSPSTLGFLTKVNAQGSAIVYSTYLGTSTTSARGVAVDLSGNAYVVGEARSAYPTTPGAYKTSAAGLRHPDFLTKFNATGDALDYSTFFGNDNVTINAVAVDAQGQAHIAGTATASGSVPATSGAAQTSYGGGSSDAFAAALNAAGSTLVYATYLGGSGTDSGSGIALDGSGNAYVAGTSSGSFPTTAGSYQPSFGGGSSNAFVSELNGTGTTQVYATYLGTTTVTGNAIAVDRSGQAYVTGTSGSGVLIDALNAAGTTLVYGKTLSGNGTDVGYGIAVDGQQRASVTGSTTSTNLPVTTGALQSSLQGSQSAFLAQYSPAGTLSYLSYLGGSTSSGTASSTGYAVAVTPTGAALVAGVTNTSNFPTSGGVFQGSNAGGKDAFLARFEHGAAAPRITSISSDTGASGSDQITTDQTLQISGTATANTTVTLERLDQGVLGTAGVSSGGTWTYDYTGTTLAEGTYDFVARDDDGSANKSAHSQDFLVTVDRTAPSVNLSVPSTTGTLAPVVRVTASDLVGIGASATVALDLATSSGGPWTSGYATGTLVHDAASLTLPALSGTGTWYLRARVLDLAGNEGTSATQSFTVNSVTSWSGSTQALSADPQQGDWLMQMGELSLSHQLDLDQSPGTGQGGNPALAYHSSQVSQQPIVQVQLTSPNNASLPASITGQLTFNGTAEATLTYSTTGFTKGDTLTMALQTSSAITATGRYGWSVYVTAGSYTHTFTGSSFVVAQDSSPFGAGWSFAGVDELVSIPSDSTGPAGMLRVYGSGGYRFFQGTSTFSSPAGDNGTLTVSGATYTYSTPDGQTWTFGNTTGSYSYLTQWTSADGNETLQYRYDGSQRLSGITAVDGALSTFTYNLGNVAIQAVNSRTTTLTLSSGELASITNPDGGIHTFTYDGSQHLTREQFGVMENNWAYTAAGVLTTQTDGVPSIGLINNPTVASLNPALTQGLSTLAAGTVYAGFTDPDGNTTQEQLDSQGRVLAQMDTDGGVTTLTYSNGFLTSQTDPLNRTTTYSLDGSGYPTKVTEPDGSVITYQYQSSFHALTTMVNERGYSTTYSYDSGGHLTRTVDALGDMTTYTYSSGLLQSVTDPLNHTTTYGYDTDRRLTTTTDALNHSVTLNYGGNGNVQTVTDQLGRVTTYNYDVMSRLTGTVDALGDRTTITWDASGLELTSTDQLGVQTSLVYDSFSRGLVVGTFEGTGSGLVVSGLSSYDAAMRQTGVRDALGSWTTTQYDGVGRVTKTTDALGNTTQNDYDLAGQMTAEQDAAGRWTTYTYNTRGWQTQATDNAGDVSSLGYDKVGNVTTSTDPLSHTVTYAYDALDRATTVTDPLSHVSTIAYDAAGNVSSTTDPNGNTTSFTYDALDRQTTMTEGVGTSVQRTTSVAYDAVGNVTSSTDGRGNPTTYAYDSLNRTTTTTDPLNHTTTLGYDAVGDLTTSTDPLGKVVTYSYDTLHRQVAVTDPLGHTATTILDAAGDTTATVDALGNLSMAIIDPLGRTVGNVDALGYVTLVTLDPTGSTRMVLDPVGNETRYVLDSAGRELVTIDPLGNRATVAYDAASRLTNVTDRNGRQIQYSYDNANREIGEVWKNAVGTVVNLVTFSYDANGNMLSGADGTGAVAYSYDALNRVQSYSNVFGQVLTYSYDGNDHVTKRTDSLGGTLTSVYDAAGNLTSRKFSGTGATGTVVRVDFGYDNRNEQTSITRYSDLAGSTVIATSVYSYDDAGRLTGIVNKDSAATTLSYYNYSYDNADRVSSQTWWSKVGTVTYSGTNTFSYDAASQLTNDSSVTYSYDGNGNRTMAGYTTGTGNRMTNDGMYTYIYDNAGNTIEKTKGSGQDTWYYSYDNANELTGVAELSNGVTTNLLITYSYDVEGNLVQQQKWTSGTGTVTTRYDYDGANVWADLDGSNNLLVCYVFGDAPDQIETRTVGSGANAGVAVYFTDMLGSVRDLANASGVVQDHIDYDAYGHVTESNSAVGDRFKYDGYQYEVSTGLYHAEARWYNPSTGTWLTQDSLGFAAGQTNLSEYVGNNPTNATDPTGLKRLTISFVTDWKTDAAAWWVSAGSDIHVDVDSRNPDWKAVKEKIMKELDGGEITEIIITGHGPSVTSAISTDKLQDKRSDLYKFLNWIHRRSPKKSYVTVRIQACEIAKGADGKQYIMTLAKVLDAYVTAWDDWYAVVPHGKEFTAYPDGTYKQTGDTKRVYYGSWIAWANGVAGGTGKPSGTAGLKGVGGKSNGVKVNEKSSNGLKDGSSSKGMK